MTIRYNFPELTAAADSVSSEVKKMTGELEGLKQTIDPMLSTWDGDARTEYYQRQTEWDAAANDLRDLLNSIEKALREAAAKMMARERANTQKFSG